MVLMSLRSRFAMAVKAFVSPQAALVLPDWQHRQPYYEPQTFESFVRQGYRKNEIIFMCIDAHQASSASVNYRVYDKAANEPLKDHPLQTLLRQPNPYMTEYDFLSLTQAFLKLAGKAYFEKTYDGRGNLVALWPLRPDYVHIIPDRQTFIGAYRYMVPGVAQIDLPPKQVLSIRYPDPLDWYASIAPVQLAARVGDVDNSTTDYIKLFFERGTMPPGVLKINQKLNDQQVGEIKRRWAERYGGFNRWFEPAILDVDATYQNVAMSFADMQFDILDERDELRIAGVLKVPPILAGLRAGLKYATYSNYETARKAWWQDVKVPDYKHIGEALTSALTPDFEDGVDLEIRADLSQVPALQEAEAERFDRADRGIQGGWVSLNEGRAMVGLPGMGPAGDVFRRAFGDELVPVDGSPVPPSYMEDAAKAAPLDTEDIIRARRYLYDTYGMETGSTLYANR